MIHLVLPPSHRPPSCPYVQRTDGVRTCLALLGEAVTAHGYEEAFGYTEGDLVFYTYPPDAAQKEMLRNVGQRSGVLHIECGVGYDVPPWGPWRVYETQAWRHFMFGKYAVPESERRASWAIPWARNLAEWPLGYGRGEYVSFLGRLMPDKGIPALLTLARRLPGVPFKVASEDDVCGLGQNVPANVEFVGPVLGAARATFLGGAVAHLCPSAYVEPLCGSAVEAMLCGTPVIASNYGGFVESITDGRSGFLCTSASEMEGVLCTILDTGADRAQVRDETVARYKIEALLSKWHAALRQMRALSRER